MTGPWIALSLGPLDEKNVTELRGLIVALSQNDRHRCLSGFLPRGNQCWLEALHGGANFRCAGMSPDGLAKTPIIADIDWILDEILD